jgi:hypothetical protein
MSRKTRIVNRLTQRLPMRRVDETSQVHDYILPAPLDFKAYVPLHESANIEGWPPLVVAGTLDIPVLPRGVRAVTVAWQADHRAGQVTRLY